MKNAFLVLFFALLFTSCAVKQYTVQVPQSVDMPKKVLFLSQSGTQSSLYQTVIDLENNEMVILEFASSRLSIVYRTGVILDPKDYRGMKVEGTDAPTKSESDSKDLNEKSGSHTDGSSGLNANPTNKL
ncbi:hypothetical protein EO244_06000 [Ancylomarina salipaludis]|uniref:Uncharacterized protein n=1 Tax=Ancylomarina salipaludis TaxID=2501299 RepID=A0A4Q1JMP4_9BACT|nr:hypothetical protein [Ancylomarina salipaludis]RXQ95858.1 hypothetical protein EO244_06000 [Ancylomarina salipaludis]